ncbi:carbon monoxide dehydrogenase subunit G [Nonomuraea sp. JJY05]|jgi:carbon monoxide dehydrogenase subunit G|uniref:SRPBCC family protein n=1 Tax=Nonomuraea sp. JJY05 TaxID=3350255 RepID=UPI00373EB7A6
MKVAGTAVIGVERDRVWAALQDPAVLVSTIPGCERLEETGPDTYRMTVNAGVASVKGVYQGEVALSDPLAPESFTLKARGQGAPGTVDATVVVRLSEVDGGTRVDYDADAVIGGMIGGVGQRMLGSVAKRTAGEFFAAVEDHLRAAEAPAGVQAAQAEAGSPMGGAVYGRVPRQHTQTRPWVMLASFGMGAGVALAGVAVGWLLGRSRRQRP